MQERQDFSATFLRNLHCNFGWRLCTSVLHILADLWEQGGSEFVFKNLFFIYRWNRFKRPFLSWTLVCRREWWFRHTHTDPTFYDFINKILNKSESKCFKDSVSLYKIKIKWLQPKLLWREWNATSVALFQICCQELFLQRMSSFSAISPSQGGLL